MSDKNPEVILQKFIKNKVPVIVRTPGHFMVATGIDLTKNMYTLNDSAMGGVERQMPVNQFRNQWGGTADSTYPRDTRNLMLVINRKE